MNKTTIEADKLFIQSFIQQRYQDINMELCLVEYFEYYWGILEDFLKEKKQLSNKIINIISEEREQIEKYIHDNNSDEAKNTEIYYLMFRTTILILKRHYNEDGKRKY